MNKTIKDLENMSVHNVTSVYSGIAGRCCCGCSGKHYRNPGFANAGDYIDANEKMVKPVIKLVQKNRFRAAGVPEDNFGENYV